jgi:hypothetical protein
MDPFKDSSEEGNFLFSFIDLISVGIFAWDGGRERRGLSGE